MKCACVWASLLNKYTVSGREAAGSASCHSPTKQRIPQEADTGVYACVLKNAATHPSAA